MSKLKTFSLYLAKPDVTDFGDLFTTGASNLVRHGTATVAISSEFADGAVLYIFPGQPMVPKWAPLLRTSFTLPTNLISQSPCALLLFKKADSFFAVSFSYGHVYLDDAKTEAEFGLRVAINAVSDERLRSVERSNIGAAIRDFAQAAGTRDLRSFGFDDALDLIRKVSGRASDDEFANMVTGARSLRFSKKIELGEVRCAISRYMCTRIATSSKSAGNLGSCGSPRLMVTFCNPRSRTRLRRLRKYSGRISSAITRPPAPTIGESRAT